jgi:hypothetical protein
VVRGIHFLRRLNPVVPAPLVAEAGSLVEGMLVLVVLVLVLVALRRGRTVVEV